MDKLFYYTDKLVKILFDIFIFIDKILINMFLKEFIFINFIETQIKN